MFHRLDYVVKNEACRNGKDWAETVRLDALAMKPIFSALVACQSVAELSYNDLKMLGHFQFS